MRALLEHGPGRRLFSAWRNTAFLIPMISVSAWAVEPVTVGQWQPRSPRDEIRPQFTSTPRAGRDGGELLTIATDSRPGLQGWWQKQVDVAGGCWYRFSVFRKTSGLITPRREVFARVLWRDAKDREVMFDEPVVDFYAN